MRKKLVSIITATYNSAEFIADTIKSIQAQTYSDWELLITDDSSDDSTNEIINSFSKKDERIKIFSLEKNSGAGIARNNSIKNAKGRFIAFCDSDDQWLPNKLMKQVSFMLKFSLKFSYSSYLVCNKSGEVFSKVVCPEKISYKKMLNNNYVGCLTAMYDAGQLGKIYMSKIRNRQDWVLWLKILKISGPTIGIRDPLAIYRDRPSSISSNKLYQLKLNFNVYRKELGYNFFYSLILTIKFLYHYVAKKI